MATTLDANQTAYDENADYAEVGSVAKAKAFVTTCRRLMQKLASEAAKGGERIRLDENIRQLRNELQAAQAYVDANDAAASGGGALTRVPSETFRG